MNRPSRTEDDLEHPTWNQSPPFLAPDLTTRQDLNGITNSRLLRKAGGLATDAFGNILDPGNVGNDSVTERDGLYLAVSCSRQKMLHGGAGPSHLLALLRRSLKTPIQGWIGWIVSVILTSVVLSSIDSTMRFARGSRVSLVPAPIRSSPSYANVYRRAGECGSAGGSEDYNTAFHVGALVIILSVSTLACSFPILATKIHWLRIPDKFLFAVRHFGTGVLIATAFVHLLPTAFTSLGDPCLSGFWTSDYPAMPGAIALAGIFLVTIVEMVFHPARQFPGGHGHSPIPSSPSNDSITPPAQGAQVGDNITAADGDGDAHDQQPGNKTAGVLTVSDPERDQFGIVLTEEQKLRKQILQCVLLEIGILFHSVFIGMALSVAVGANFVVLLIAIAFHQTFEGLALGARIAAIDWPRKTKRPWMMALAYGLTTPIGQAIGLATHSLYSPDSAFGLVLVGTMNAISSGLLVYASLIELLAEDLLSEESFKILRGRKRIVACLLVFAGAFCMSLVGAWA